MQNLFRLAVARPHNAKPTCSKRICFLEALQHKRPFLLAHVILRIHKLEDLLACPQRLLKAVVEQRQTCAPDRTT